MAKKNDEQANVFDMASKREKKEPKKKKINPEYEKYAQMFANVPKTVPEDFHPEKDLETSFAYYRKLQDEINEKVEENYKLMGTNSEEVQEHLSSSDRSSSQESWEEMQELKKKLDQQMQAMLPVEDAEKKKIRSSFSKRKSWISMD